MNNIANSTKTTSMGTTLIIVALCIGLAAGVLSGLVGVGGGIIMVPALVIFMHYSQQQAQGTSLAVLTLPVVILASVFYYRQCQQQGHPIDLRVVGLLAFGFIGGAWVGSKWALSIDEEQLKKIFSVILFYTAFKMLGWDSALFKWVSSRF